MLRSDPARFTVQVRSPDRTARPGRWGLVWRVVGGAALVLILVLSAPRALSDTDGLPHRGLTLIGELATALANSEANQPMDECEQVTANPLFGSLKDELVQIDGFRCGDVFPPVAALSEP